MGLKKNQSKLQSYIFLNDKQKHGEQSAAQQDARINQGDEIEVYRPVDNMKLYNRLFVKEWLIGWS